MDMMDRSNGVIERTKGDIKKEFLWRQGFGVFILIAIFVALNFINLTIDVRVIIVIGYVSGWVLAEVGRIIIRAIGKQL